MSEFDFSKRNGYIIVIIQDARTKRVLMHGFMDPEALELTSSTKETWLYSTSRKELWHKGATSDSIMKVIEAEIDCDGDAILLHVEVQGTGLACHLDEVSCFKPIAL